MEPRIFPIYPPSAVLFGKVLAASFAVITAFFAVLTLALYAAIDPDGPVARIAAPVALGSSYALILFIFFSVLTWFYLSARRTDFVLLEGYLLIRNSAHGKHFTHDELKVEEARVVDLPAAPQYRPGGKIFAISAFFFYGGRFICAAGRRRTCSIRVRRALCTFQRTAPMLSCSAQPIQSPCCVPCEKWRSTNRLPNTFWRRFPWPITYMFQTRAATFYRIS